MIRQSEMLFDFAPKPPELTAESIGVTAAEWVDSTISYDANCTVFDAEDCLKAGKGTCYGQALGGVALLEHWNIPTGIAIRNSPLHHASTVFEAQEGPLLDSIGFIEPAYSHYSDVLSYCSIANEGMPLDIARDVLKSARRVVGGDIDHVVFAKMPSDLRWTKKENVPYQQDKQLAKYSKAFTIASPSDGYNSLEAIATLKTLFHSDKTHYNDVYSAYISDVPDFIYFPKPKPGYEE